MPGLPSNRNRRRLTQMRHTAILIVCLFVQAALIGQEALEGKVSYLTSSHVYVRFSSTEGLQDGDTLYRQGNRGEVPALVILSHSSTSCVCEPLGNLDFRVSDRITGRPVRTPDGETEGKELQPAAAAPVVTELPPGTAPEASAREATGKERRQEIHGRVSLASYSYLKNPETDGRQRMRYTLSLAAHNIAGSGLSVESYATFSHTLNRWDEIRENLFRGLKIYNLSASYAFRGDFMLTAGRKINPKLSSVGAIDGLQLEKGFGGLSTGIIAGSRPDYQDYSFNTDLLQYGAYLAHQFKGKAGTMQNTVAFIEQTNKGTTDRRFLYVQHSNTLVTNLWFFASMEADLYQKLGESEETVFRLYNTYLSLRYRVVSPLTLALSYSARNHLIYYESYKDFLDRLMDESILQGWRFRVNYHPISRLYLGAHAAYRYRDDDPMPTKNAHGYATFTKIPGIGASVTASVTWMQSAYLDGMIYGMGIRRDFLKGKLHADLKYHYVDHSYRMGETAIVQHVGEAGLYWAIYRKLSLSVHYEGTFEASLGSHRIFAGLSQRF